jgi:glutaconate CoA-transferase subunit A
LSVARQAGDKLVGIEAACAAVADGDLVAIGGHTLYRRPAALARELIRAGRRDLELIGLTLGYESDLLIAAGCVSTIRSGYVGLDFIGAAPHFRADSEVRVVEETEASIICGLRATLGHVDFLPFRGLLGTDVMRARPDLRVVRSPYTDEEYVAWPALEPDVALLHVAECDRYGNAVIPTTKSLDRMMASAAKTTIVSAERIVDTDEVARQGAALLAPSVSAVVHVPFGAHPTSSYPDYRMDVGYLLDYVEQSRAGEPSRQLAEAKLSPEEYGASVVARAPEPSATADST